MTPSKINKGTTIAEAPKNIKPATISASNTTIIIVRIMRRLPDMIANSERILKAARLNGKWFM